MSAESKDFDYGAVLADLRSKREKIDRAILALEALTGIEGIAVFSLPAQSSASQPSEGDDFLGMTIPEAAIKLLRRRRKQMTNSEILAGLQAGGMAMTSADPLNTVGAVITRRSKDVGDIVKLGRGVWGLKEWHPYRNFNRPKGNGEGEATLSSSESEQPSEQLKSALED